MTSALVLLRDPEHGAMNFADIAPAFPGLRIRAAHDPHEALADIPDADILITLGVHLGKAAPALFGAAERLQWVQLIGTGTDNVAEHLIARPDVAITNARGLHGAQMSEAAIAAMLSWARQTPRIVRNQLTRTWDRFPARVLARKTVGIFGMGAIAETLAPLCKAFGMTVIGITGTVRPLPHFDRVYARAALCEAVATVDYLVLLAPHSPENHCVIDASVFAAMKPSAFLVNLARGGIVDEAALLLALQGGQIAGAALDVFADEPLPPDHPLWTADNVIVTPHLGGFHEDYASDVRALVTDNLARFLSGGTAALRNRI